MFQILLFATFLTVISPEQEFLEQWFSALSDPSEDCYTETAFTETVDDSFSVFEVAKDCSEVDARWDYNFLSRLKSNKGVFEGQGKIVLPVKVKRDFRPEHNNYKFGFRHNKCLKLFSNDVSRIEGNFVKDRLEGKVRIDFHSGDFLVGQAKSSRLVGAVRFFDSKQELINVTTFRKGQADISISRTSSLQLYRMTTSSGRAVNRAYYTKDFSTVYNCEEEEPHLLRKCYEAKNIKSVVRQCDLDIHDDTAVPPNDQVFSWYLRSDSKHFENEPPYPNCSPEWRPKSIAQELKAWFKEISTPEVDPFWTESRTNVESPFSKVDPILSFSVSELLGRGNVAQGVNISTLENVPLGSTAWSDGRVEMQAKEVAAEIDNHSWSRMLKFKFATSEAGVHFSKEDERDVLNFGMIARLRNGRLHGNVRRFGRIVTDPMHSCGSRVFRGLSYVGRYEDGVPVGVAWRGVIGDGYIYGTPDVMTGQLTGEEVAFVYPDFETALLGRFSNGIMLEGRRVRIVGVRCVNGIKEIKFSAPEGPTYYHNLATNSSFGDQPLLTDPLDETYIEVRESGVDHENADEGAFAKRNIPAGETITLYSGLVFKDQEISEHNEAKKKDHQFDDQDDPEYWKVTKYHGSVSECQFTITIPFDQGALSQYRATLGHKLNHSFKPNCEYGGLLDSPRFGLVRAFHTNKAIKQGEELFISYGYPVANAPPWYKELHKQIMEKEGESGFSNQILDELKRKEDLNLN